LWFLFTARYGKGWGPAVLVAGLVLSYHYVCEITVGQSIGKRATGLRVVSLDGSAPTYRQVSARTVLRLIDQGPPIIGLIVMVLSGKRRQRLGDLAAGTAVVRAADHPAGRRAFSIDVVAYPLAWVAPAAVVFGLWISGHFPGTYRSAAESLCAQASAAIGTSPSFDGIFAIQSELLSRLNGLKVPANWRGRHDLLVHGLADEEAVAGDVIALARSGRQREARTRYDALRTLAHQHNAALRSSGYDDCAG
jgi:hypothetical protein